MTEKARILVIDDDDSVRKVLTMALEDKGYTVDAARDANEAMEKSRSSLYNLAFIDVRLPDMEGTELLRMLKETAPKTAKIILTGYPSLGNAVKAVNEGADGYIIKPFKMEKLLSTVEEHLKKQREAQTFTEEKVAEYIETRARELESVRTESRGRV